MTKMVCFSLTLHGLLRRLLRLFLLLWLRWFGCLLILRFAKIEVCRPACSKVENKRFNKVRLEHFRHAASHIFDLLVRIITGLLVVLLLISPMLLHITQTLQTSTLHTTNALISLLVLLGSASVKRCANTSLLWMLCLNCFRKQPGVGGYSATLWE